MRNPSRRAKTILVTAAAALAGFLFVASGITADGTNLRTGGLEDLRSLVLDRADKVGVLQSEVDTLATEVNDLSITRVDPALSAQISQLEQATGLTPVSGSALRISLDDAPRESGTPLPSGVVPDDLVVHQQDVQSVVNAMWRGGATAVQVMDQRIISTSAIRCVGNTLLLQGRVYSPPFVITAVGNTSELQQALNDEPGVSLYREYVERFNLGWDVSILNQTTIPAWQGSIEQQ
ncbi:MAG: DUF881 domain-containing protein [Candidatus Nanopelagicales bacterium]|jgi:uncharacterized protein YlxW (UPF0749 family)